jgi:N-methylhydantoinase B
MLERNRAGLHVYRGDERPRFDGASDANPITTEIIRRALNSAALQMSRATVRTAFSLPIYEGLDFAVVLYDRHLRLLAQAPTSPLFMGTMSFCIEAAVAAVGGQERLEAGDVLVYNKPYGTGSHAQDCAVIVPVFMPDGQLVGYAGNKAHWLDIGAKSIYCSDTTDVFQEGVVIPGVKLLSRGRWNEDLHRMILANSRTPAAIDGDQNAQIESCKVGARELLGVFDRFGYPT